MLGATANAFEGDIVYSKRQGEVERELRLSHWHASKKQVAEFDYVYTEKGKQCQFSVTGHALADLESEGVPTVFNPEDANGKETDQIWTFSDKSVLLTLPYDARKLKKFAYFSIEFTPEIRKQSCTKKGKNLEAAFGRAK
ncbi:MAG: hypothetical protein HYZ45_09020 [Burkholderiales bacterium]|nr:hypothetical protein [Burkholderiales bacterium]